MDSTVFKLVKKRAMPRKRVIFYSSHSERFTVSKTSARGKAPVHAGKEQLSDGVIS